MVEDTRAWLRGLDVPEPAIEEINAAIFKLVRLLDAARSEGPLPDVSGLVEALRQQAQREAEAHRWITDARYGEHYSSLTKEQTTSWRAADTLERLATPQSPQEPGR